MVSDAKARSYRVHTTGKPHLNLDLQKIFHRGNEVIRGCSISGRSFFHKAFPGTVRPRLLNGLVDAHLHPIRILKPPHLLHEGEETMETVPGATGVGEDLTNGVRSDSFHDIGQAFLEKHPDRLLVFTAEVKAAFDLYLF
jgi:hypothetical protein